MGMDSVELVLELEEAFGIRIPDRDCGEIRRVCDIVAMVRRHVLEQRGPDAPVYGIETQIRWIVANSLGVKFSRVELDSILVDDLGMS